jgi:hypothetical protein
VRSASAGASAGASARASVSANGISAGASAMPAPVSVQMPVWIQMLDHLLQVHWRAYGACPRGSVPAQGAYEGKV